MRLLISGYFGAGNVGDEAILGGLLRALRSDAGSAAHRITVVSSDPRQTERVHGVGAIPRLRPATITAIGRADGIISGGGGLFQDATSGRPALYYGGLTHLARALGRPYVVLAQGLGPLRGRVQRSVTSRTLAHAAHVSLRDAGSIALARALGVQRPIDLVPDLALGLDAPEIRPQDRIVVALRGRGLAPAWLAAFARGVAGYGTHLEVVVLPMHDPADRAASTALVESIPGARMAPDGPGYANALRTIASARLVIGMRLHALVLAALGGVPAVALPYDPKVEAFAASVGLPVVRLRSGAAADLAGAAEEALAVDVAAYRLRVDRLRAGVGPAVTAAIEALGRS